MAALPLQVPPQALDAEMAVLGSMLLESEAAQKAVDVLHEDDFYKDAHKAIFASMKALFDAGTAADVVTVSEDLRRRNTLGEVGGVGYLAECCHKVSTAAHVEHYANIVHEKAILRQLLAAATRIASDCYSEGDPASLLDEAEASILAISQRQHTSGFTDASKLAQDLLAEIESLHSRKQAVTGVPTGFKALDQKTAGFQNGELILVAARPGQGKTSLALTMATHMVLEVKRPVAFFSMEMSRSGLGQRLVSGLAHVDLHKVRTGYFEHKYWTNLTNAMSRLSEAPLHIDDSPGLSILDVRSRSRKLAADLKRRKAPLSLIMVDYLQLMRGASRRVESRQQEVAEISRGLKFLARDLNIPVVALSQLSRRVEEKGRADGRPQLSDLRESGALEQDADVVIFIHREAAYKPNDPNVDENKAEFIIAKQRQGPTGSVEVRFNRALTRFENLDASGEEPPEADTPLEEQGFLA